MKLKHKITVNELAYQALKNAALFTLDDAEVEIVYDKYKFRQYRFPVDDAIFAHLANDLKVLNVDNVSSYLIRHINTYIPTKGEK